MTQRCQKTGCLLFEKNELCGVKYRPIKYMTIDKDRLFGKIFFLAELFYSFQL